MGDTMNDIAILTRRMLELADEADRIHIKAQTLNKKGLYDEAKVAYAEFRLKDDEACDVAAILGGLRSAALKAPMTTNTLMRETPLPLGVDAAKSTSNDQSSSSSTPAFTSSASFTSSTSTSSTTTPLSSSGILSIGPAPTPFALVSEDVETLRMRCLGAIVGGCVGDAAAMGVQWIYNPAELDKLFQDAAARGKAGLDFFEPPSSPFLQYESGRNSPYGEQAHLLLRCLAKRGCLDTTLYAQMFADEFGGDWAGRTHGYRDQSCKGFLRNWAIGKLPPETGCGDSQVNCCARLPSLVAMYVGGQSNDDLFACVEAATRVTQNNDRAVAWATLHANTLAGILRGLSPREALQTSVRLGETAVDDPRFSYEVADHMYLAAGYLRFKMLPLVPREHELAVRELGKNCHLPNALQTPMQNALHHISLLEKSKGCARASAGSRKSTDGGNSGNNDSRKDAGDNSENGPCGNLNADSSSSSSSSPTAATTTTTTATTSSSSSSSFSPDPLTAAEAQELYARAIRDAVRQGGCCASRAGVLGAVLGAYLAGRLGSLDFIPDEWRKKTLVFEEAKDCAERICALRS